MSKIETLKRNLRNLWFLGVMTSTIGILTSSVTANNGLPSGWESFPVEMQVEVLRKLAASDPVALGRFYITANEMARKVIDGDNVLKGTMEVAKYLQPYLITLNSETSLEKKREAWSNLRRALVDARELIKNYTPEQQGEITRNIHHFIVKDVCDYITFIAENSSAYHDFQLQHMNLDIETWTKYLSDLLAFGIQIISPDQIELYETTLNKAIGRIPSGRIKEELLMSTGIVERNKLIPIWAYIKILEPFMKTDPETVGRLIHDTLFIRYIGNRLPLDIESLKYFERTKEEWGKLPNADQIAHDLNKIGYAK